MLIGSRCPKEIRLCPGCKHQVVALVFLSLCSFSGSRLEINRDHFAQLYIHVGMALEDAAQRKRRIARRQYGGRHLAELTPGTPNTLYLHHPGLANRMRSPTMQSHSCCAIA